MTLIAALILAVVEGFTEFLPISSTGHLILTAHLLRLPQTEFVKSFEIIIQMGAILAVVMLYWRTIASRPQLWKPILAAFVPTGIVGVLFYSIIRRYLLGNEWVTVAALCLGGIVLIGIESRPKPERENHETTGSLSLRKAFLIGVFQTLSVIPGVSRAAASIIGGMMTGLSRKDAVEFSFLLSVPTMAAATGLDILKSTGSLDARQVFLLSVGFVCAFLTAIISIRTFLSYVQTHSLRAFGVYRIIIAVLYVMFVLR